MNKRLAITGLESLDASEMQELLIALQSLHPDTVWANGMALPDWNPVEHRQSTSTLFHEATCWTRSVRHVGSQPGYTVMKYEDVIPRYNDN